MSSRLGPFRPLGALIVSSLLLLSACLNDRPPNQMSIKLGENLTGCLDHFDATIRDYFNGRTTEPQVVQLFDCASQGLDLFMKHTRGQKTGTYDPEELRTFIQRYFLHDKKITDKLLHEAMVFKQAILGGTDQEIKVGELQQTIEILRVVKIEAISLRPHMAIEPEHFNDLRGDAVEAGLAAIEHAGKSLSGILTHAAVDYQLKSFSKLLLELQYLLEKGSEGRGPRVLRDNIEVFGAAKQILFSGPSTAIQPKEWPMIADIGSRWYSYYLRYENLVARQFVDWRRELGVGESWGFGQALMDFGRMVDIGRRLMSDGLKLHPGSVLSFDKLKNLVNSLTVPDPDKAGGVAKDDAWRPFDKELSNYLKTAFEPLIQKVLGGSESGPDGRDAAGVTPALVDRIWTDFANWFGQQKYLETLFSQLGGDKAFRSVGYSRQALLSVPIPHNVPLQVGFTTVPLALTKAASTDMEHVIQTFRPLFLGEQHRVYFPDGAPGKNTNLYSYDDLSRMNWMVAVERTFFRGYAEDKEQARSARGLKEKELDNAYWDFRGLGVKVGFLDASSTVAGVSRFRESNLFTSVADGGDELSVDKGMELMSFIFSAGSVSGTMMEEIGAACKDSTKDEYGYYQVPVECYREQFVTRFEQYWEQMPGMVRYFKSLRPADRTAVLVGLENIARKGEFTSDELVTKFENDTIVMIIHYVESLMLRYDTNLNGTIDSGAEVDEVFRTFSNLLRGLPAVQKLGWQNDDKMLRSLLLFLLANGDVPKDAIDLAKLKWFPDPEVHADRGVVLRIFGNLMSGITGATATP